MTHKALIGIGSNLGSPQENCKRAISLLCESDSINLLKQAALYQSEPIGKANQPWFVNAAIEIQTTLSPESLLKTLLNIEQQMGRTRSEKWGPRIIDLDILDYEGRMINTSGGKKIYTKFIKRTTPNPGSKKTFGIIKNPLSKFPYFLKPLLLIFPKEIYFHHFPKNVFFHGSMDWWA